MRLLSRNAVARRRFARRFAPHDWMLAALVALTSLGAPGVRATQTLEQAAAEPTASQTPVAPAIELTPDERQWLRDHPVITLSVDDQYPPRNFRDKQGQMAGISIDYIRLMSQRLGVEVRFEGANWSEALAKAMAHKVDGIINADALEERKPYLLFTEVYAPYPQALVTRKDEPAIRSVADFAGRRVAVKRDTSQMALLRAKHPGLKLVEIDSLEQGLNWVIEGRADGVYDDIAVLDYEISERHLTNVRFALVYYQPPVGYSRIGLRKDAPVLLSIFNKAIATITAEDRRRIQRRWLGIDLPTPPEEAARLALTDEETAWLRMRPVIRVALDSDRPPLEFLGPAGRPQGIAVDYLREIERMLNLRFRIVTHPSRKPLALTSRNREADLIACAAPTSQLRETLLFSRPYVSFPMVVFTRLDIPFVAGLIDLEGKRVACVKNAAPHEWILTEATQLQIIPVASVEEGLRRLANHEVDAFIDDILTTGYHLSKLNYGNIKVAGDLGRQVELSMAVRNDWPLFAGIVQKALDAIPKNRRDAITRQWTSVRYEHGADYSLLWKAAVGVVILILGFFFWNARLRAEVARQTRELTRANRDLRREIEERKRSESDRARLEDQLRQAQKMEAVGQLAGGIAHDFNNLLLVINGYAELMLMTLPPDSPLRPQLAEIAGAGQRAARLVSQLLAFSRRQILKMEDLDLNAVITDLLRMLPRMIGEHVELKFEPGVNLPVIRADRGAMDQIVINLAVNARDAMPEGGRLKIATDAVTLDASFCDAHPWARPGTFVRLSVSDNGCGMDAETLSHIFEPFFTTKEPGKGTGLGLSTVYGIVSQHNGLIDCHSALGKGTTFFVYLPATPASAEDGPGATAPPPPGGTETVLLAEDDPAVRAFTTRTLQEAGYAVLAAADGREALDLFHRNRERVAVLLLDIVMPNVGGKAVADAALKARPGIPILFTTGYSQEAIHSGFLIDKGFPMLQKPFGRDDLLRAVRAALDRASRS